MDQLRSLVKKIIRLVQPALVDLRPRQKTISGNGVIDCLGSIARSDRFAQYLVSMDKITNQEVFISERDAEIDL